MENDEIRQLGIDYIEEKHDGRLSFQDVNDYGECRDFAYYLEDKKEEVELLAGYIQSTGTYHTFVKIGDKYYDIENLEGVESPDKLNYIERMKLGLSENEFLEMVKTFLDSIEPTR